MKSIIVILIILTAAFGFEQDPTLVNLADGTWHQLSDQWCSAPWNTTDYSGSVYDHHRLRFLISAVLDFTPK